ncbi:MAG TPA: DNA methyltransferase [Ottowia sp.]|nr:DNA methyltransferase [Ottowia sp.]
MENEIEGAVECVRIGPALLVLGDCRALLGRLPKADVLVSDPPYGIGYQHSGGGQGRIFDGLGNVLKTNAVPTSRATIIGDDEPFDPQPYVGLAPRVLMWGADHYRARLPAGGRFLAWDKSVGGGPADSFADSEHAWTNVETIKRTVFRHLWKGFARKADRWGPSRRARLHISQKPVALMRWCIETLRCPPGGVVLDPFMGSGSTGVAALTLGMRFVGVDIDRAHYDTARERIAHLVQVEQLGVPPDMAAKRKGRKA